MDKFVVLKTAVEAISWMRSMEDKWKETFDDMFDLTIPKFYNEPIEAIIKMVEETFDDVVGDDGYSIFSWWIFEAEMGKNKDIAESFSIDGIKIPLRTIDDLYNFYKTYNIAEYIAEKTKE